MYAPKRLMRRPRPYPMESLISYIIRLTESNYYSDINWILQMSGLKKKRSYVNIFNQADDDLSLLSWISDVEETVLWSMSFSTVNKFDNRSVYHVNAFGNLLPKKAINNNSVKFCPVCLQTTPYYRLIWDLAFIRICPLHNCLLIDICPQCQCLIKWYRPSIIKCKCSQVLTECQPQFVTSDSTGLSLHIYQLCQITELPLVQRDNIYESNPLMLLDLNRIVSLCYFMMTFFQLPYIQDKFSSWLESRFDLFKYGCYFDIAFSLLNNWDDEFSWLMSGYEGYLESTYGSKECRHEKQQSVLSLFRSVSSCFPGESYRCFQDVIEVYFWDMLARTSVKKIQICWQKTSRQVADFISADIKQYNYLLLRVAGELRLTALTWSQLLMWSQVEIRDDTIFFLIFV